MDTRVWRKRWGTRYRETGYRRPCRAQKGDCLCEMARVVEGNKGRPATSRVGRESRERLPFIAGLSESQFRVTARHALPLSAMAETRKPVCIIAIGMAGSGKSTFVQRLNTHLHARSPPAPPYVLNLDPAVTNISYEPNIDIRDTVDYHQVMRQCAVAVPLCSLR